MVASSDTQDRFGFGENWADYIEKNFSEERLEISKNHLLDVLKLDTLAGKTFLDIGCGSGLHSLAAYRAGADSIFSFDYDINSVNTTKKLRDFAGAPDHWTVEQGSILDVDYVKKLPVSDVVYSWGVLHHTGEMWQAIENASIPIKNEGVFYIALYTTDIYIDPPPEYWLKTKKAYNKAGALKKRMMELAYAYPRVIRPALRRFKNPLTEMKEYKASRGMSYWTDVRDWLGGWPMEFAGIQETKDFCSDKLNLELVNIVAGEGNTEYVFKRKGEKNYWNSYFEALSLYTLDPPFAPVDGNAWCATLPDDVVPYDEPGSKASKLMLYENDVPLGFPHCNVRQIAKHGGSRYLHEKGKLIFSTTDNSDPNQNGRRYTYSSL